MKRIATFLILTTLGGAPLRAMPSQITFQGTLKQQGTPVNTTKNMQFSFVDGSGATISGTTPVSIANVQVTNGLFAVQLPIDPSIPWAQYTPYIRVSVEGQILSPDQPLNANLYAVAAIPQGMIAMFATTCPQGWTIFTGLQGKFPVGADPVNTTQFTTGQSGGNLSHNHSISVDGGHKHRLPIFSDAGESTVGVAYPGNNPFGYTSGSDLGNVGVHQPANSGISFLNPPVNVALSENSGSHNHGGLSGVSSSLPPYLTVIFCQKL